LVRICRFFVRRVPTLEAFTDREDYAIVPALVLGDVAARPVASVSRSAVA
jgi:hypothetical protein